MDLEASRLWIDGRATTVVAVPIGVDYDRIQDIAAESLPGRTAAPARSSTCNPRSSASASIARLHKGIPERLAALDALLTRRLRGRLTFIQIGVPSRSDLHSYAEIEAEINDRIHALNARHAARRRVVSSQGAAPPQQPLHSTVRAFCIVSSLHDGMNLVAKEFVASRDDEEACSCSTPLAGAAQSFTGTHHQSVDADFRCGAGRATDAA